MVECWAHEACLVPAADIALHRGWRSQRAQQWAHRNAEATYRDQRAGMDSLLAAIGKSGPLKTSDYAKAAAHNGVTKAGWWAWKPEERWIETWFALGELMVARRENCQRVYDLTENVLETLDPPFDRTAETSSPASLRQSFISDSVRALGVTRIGWIADYFRLKPAVTASELAPLLARGELVAVAVSGWAADAYVHRDHADALGKATLGRLRARHTIFLSPFATVAWDRARVRTLFNFDYTLECYTPQPKRRYGYFVLPILHRGKLIGRVDAKAHRMFGTFEIKKLFLEPGVKASLALLNALAAALIWAAKWHETPDVAVMETQSAVLTRSLRAALAASL